VILQPVTPIVVRVVEEPTRETSVADILLGAVGFVGFVLIAAAVVGLLAGGLFILFRVWRAKHTDPRDSSVSLNLSSLHGTEPTP
jgi:hypothetical protein